MLQVYVNKSWSLAEDHIHHTIGRQATMLKQMTEAADAFAQLLPRASRQSATQQATFLREYLNTQQVLLAYESWEFRIQISLLSLVNISLL